MVIDIGAGILFALLTGHVLHFFATPSFIVLGIAFALLPDIDIVLSALPPIRAIIGEHRSAVHHPFIYLFIAPVVWVIWGNAVGLLFALGVSYHLIHDTFFLGYGIKWLWPLSQKTFSLFHDRDGYITRDILVWGPEDDARIKATYQSPHWVRDFYFRPSLVSLTEYPVLIIAIALLCRHFFM